MHKVDVVILTQETADSISSSQDEATDVWNHYYLAGVIYLPLERGIKKGAWSL